MFFFQPTGEPILEHKLIRQFKSKLLPLLPPPPQQQQQRDRSQSPAIETAAAAAAKAVVTAAKAKPALVQAIDMKNSVNF